MTSPTAAEGAVGTHGRFTRPRASGSGLSPHDPGRRPAPRPASVARGRFSTLRLLLLGADAWAGLLGGTIAALVGGVELLLPMTAAVAVWPVLTWVAGLYAASDLNAWASGIGDSGRVVVASLLGSWALVGLLAVSGAEHAERGALAGAAAFGIGTAALRALARVEAHRRRSLRQRTLIVGAGMVADRLVSRLRDHDELGLDPIGLVDDDTMGSALSDVPRLGSLDELDRVLAEHRVDRVMFAFSRSDHTQLLAAVRTCRDAGLPVDVVPRLFELLDGAQTLDQIGGLPLLSIEAPRLSRVGRAAKRTIDVAGSLTGLAILSPVLLAAAVAIKLESKGPALFRQVRVGRGGRHFTLYKFRSMREGAVVLVRPDGAIVKNRDDDRITRVGALLRRLSLDEMPQLLNVLRGDMSLVGPRPLVLAEAATLTHDWQIRRADLRPGLTGPWQIAGRSNIPFQEMIYYDYQYVSNWSLGRDVAILSATVPAVLSGRGAY